MTSRRQFLLAMAAAGTTPRGVWFDKKRYESAALPNFDALRSRLPEPLFDSRPDWIGAYWKAWELAFRNFYEPLPGSGFVSQYIDAAFSGAIFLWDTCFMTMFTNVAHPLVPGIGSLDNFYALQRPSGEMGREIDRRTGRDYSKWINTERRPLFSRWGWDGFAKGMRPLGPDEPVVYVGREAPKEIPELTLDALDHPIAAWAEWESYRVTGDRARLKAVCKPLERYYRFLQEHLRQGNGLYITDWASMDDSPRNPYLKGGGTAVDTSAEMAQCAECLMHIAAAAGVEGEAPRFRAEAVALQKLVRERMWDPARGFFFDLRGDGRFAPARTIAGYWPLVAGAADGKQAAACAALLNDPRAFGAKHRVPTCAADEPGYRAGNYWKGAVWAPTNTMVLRGLERYGYGELARTIGVEHLDMAARTWRSTGTLWENYSPEGPEPGKPARKDFVGWSGLGPILYLLEYGIGLVPDAPANRLTWRLNAEAPNGCKRYRFNGHVVDLAAEPRDGRVRATVESDGAFELRLVHARRTRKERIRPGRRSITV